MHLDPIFCVKYRWRFGGRQPRNGFEPYDFIGVFLFWLFQKTSTVFFVEFIAQLLGLCDLARYDLLRKFGFIALSVLITLCCDQIPPNVGLLIILRETGTLHWPPIASSALNVLRGTRATTKTLERSPQTSWSASWRTLSMSYSLQSWCAKHALVSTARSLL